MTAPAIVSGYTQAGNASNSTTLAISVPTHEDGDLLVVVYITDGDASTASISGSDWTTLEGPKDIPSGANTTAGSFYVWAKAAVSEGTSWTITQSVSERALAFAFAVSGHDGIEAEATYASGTDSSAESNSLTTTVDDCLRISIVGSVGVRTVSTLTGHTLLGTHSYTSAGTISVQYKTIATAGADAGQTATLDSTGWCSYAFAIKPAATSQTIDLDTIGSTATVYAPTLIVGDPVIYPAYIASTAVVYAPRLAFTVTPTRRTYVIEAEERTYSIRDEPRTYTVEAEDRTYVILGDH